LAFPPYERWAAVIPYPEERQEERERREREREAQKRRNRSVTRCLKPLHRSTFEN